MNGTLEESPKDVAVRTRRIWGKFVLRYDRRQVHLGIDADNFKGQKFQGKRPFDAYIINSSFGIGD